MYSGEYVCGVTLSVHPHRASWKVCLTTVGIEPKSIGLVFQRSRVRFHRWQTFQLARCGCTLRVTPQTFKAMLYEAIFLPLEFKDFITLTINAPGQNLSKAWSKTSTPLITLKITIHSTKKDKHAYSEKITYYYCILCCTIFTANFCIELTFSSFWQVWNKLLSSCSKVDQSNRLATSCSNETGIVCT